MKRFLGILVAVLGLALVVGTGILYFTIFKGYADARRVATEKLEPYRPGISKAPEFNEQLLVSGTVASDSKQLIHDLVAGCEMIKTVQAKHHRVPGKRYVQPLYLETGNGRVRVDLGDPCESVCPQKELWHEPSNRTFAGYRRGDSITLLGNVRTANPLVVRAKIHCKGSKQALLSELKYGEEVRFPMLVVLALLASLGMVGLGVRWGMSS